MLNKTSLKLIERSTSTGVDEVQLCYTLFNNKNNDKLIETSTYVMIHAYPNSADDCVYEVELIESNYCYDDYKQIEFKALQNTRDYEELTKIFNTINSVDLIKNNEEFINEKQTIKFSGIELEQYKLIFLNVFETIINTMLEILMNF